MKLVSSLATCLLLLTPALRADEAAPANIRIEVQMVAVPQAKALELLPNLRDAGSTEYAFSEIQKMIARGEAKLIAWPEVTTRSGQRAVTEDIEEVRYATQFDKKQPPSPRPKRKSAKQKDARAVGQSAEVPSAFETRNIGVTLEVEPSVSEDGKAVNLKIIPQHVRLLGFKTEQPQFYTTKTTTSLTVASGQRVLLASFRVTEPADHLEFFILKAEVLPSPAK